MAKNHHTWHDLHFVETLLNHIDQHEFWKTCSCRTKVQPSSKSNGKRTTRRWFACDVTWPKRAHQMVTWASKKFKCDECFFLGGGCKQFSDFGSKSALLPLCHPYIQFCLLHYQWRLARTSLRKRSSNFQSVWFMHRVDLCIQKV